jgi:hypothetical protein
MENWHIETQFSAKGRYFMFPTAVRPFHLTSYPINKGEGVFLWIIAAGGAS